MADMEKLKKIISDSGLKKVFIAEKLGISYQGYLKKENGICRNERQEGLDPPMDLHCQYGF
jgi:hypothetical protein